MKRMLRISNMNQIPFVDLDFPVQGSNVNLKKVWCIFSTSLRKDSSVDMITVSPTNVPMNVWSVVGMTAVKSL